MLDLRRIRKNPQELLDGLEKRGKQVDLAELFRDDEDRRSLMAKAEALKNRRNEAGKEMAKVKRSGGDTKRIVDEMKQAGETINDLDEQIKLLDEKTEQFLLNIPNIPDETVPAGESQEIRRADTPRVFPYEPKTYRDIGTDLGIADFDTGAGQGLGARLQRALINFFLDTWAEAGCVEVQLPWGMSVTDLCKDMILDGSGLPTRRCAYSAQLNKVDVAYITKPEKSCEALEVITNQTEKFLSLLGMPCQVVCLGARELSHSSAKTYHVEVWLPSRSGYVEIASCSDYGDFMARRSAIRYREDPKGKPQLAHTLGSSLTVGTAMAAILENFQNEDGTVAIPQGLASYMGTEKIGKR